MRVLVRVSARVLVNLLRHRAGRYKIVYVPGVLAMVALFMVNTVDARDLSAEHTETAEGAVPGALKMWLCGGLVLGVVSVIIAISSYVDTWSRHVDIKDGPVSAAPVATSAPPAGRCVAPCVACLCPLAAARDTRGCGRRGLRLFCNLCLSSSHRRGFSLRGLSAPTRGGARILSCEGQRHTTRGGEGGRCVPPGSYHSMGPRPLAARLLPRESGTPCPGVRCAVAEEAVEGAPACNLQLGL